MTGHNPDYPVRTRFNNRQLLSQAGIHRPPQAGICGSQTYCAESIVLNKGYIDDIDMDKEIIYTGHGGNDLRTGRQVANQSLRRQNLALYNNISLKIPVRVIRGYKEKLGPDSGYRYDGLYYVYEYWEQIGKDGFKICRYKLIKTQDNEYTEFIANW